MQRKQKLKLIGHLSSFITESRNKLLDEVLQSRTRYVTVALEDIFQPHNASAVLRTCDCFGVQDVHIIENQNKYEVNPDVALGSSKWLNLVRYDRGDDNSDEAFRNLKEKGYTLVATSPRKNGILLSELPPEIKPAFVFGTELRGLSETALSAADLHMRIPMYGFTESFNISVSAALILHEYTEKLRKSEINWRLTEDEKLDIKLSWLRNSIKRSELIEQEFLKNS